MNKKFVMITVGILLFGLTPYVCAQESIERAERNTQSDHSGVFLEPGITYSGSSSSINYPAPFRNSTGSINGLGVMARIGVHANETFFLAADGRFSRPNFIDSTNNFEATATAYNIGAVAGLQMPTLVGLRVWGTWVFAGGVDPEASNNLDANFTGASGYRIGAGLKVAIVSFNLEYQRLTYDTELESVGPFDVSRSFSDVALTDSALVLTLSMPLNL